MKKTIQTIALVLAVSCMSSLSVTAQTTGLKTKTTVMKTYVIEREMPGVGSLTAAQLKSASQNSCSVIAELGPEIEWVHSYVTGNKIFCVYKAENEEVIREHAKKAGLPCNRITEVTTIISPETAKAN
ncbi:MAG TPA: DUF4242 domain-containing protein [Chitinophagaceae bacterium]|jgi:hypothetical protein|nr:DUF4242 domain-containing protein [Chitinophagaceae bacterium]